MLIKEAMLDVEIFIENTSNITLRKYQRGVAKAICESIFSGSGYSFVIMFPRQSGKNELQAQLEGTENRINVARQRYNKAVEAFNYAIRKFPNSLTNSLLLHLERKEYFKAEEGAKEVPKVQF